MPIKLDDFQDSEHQKSITESERAIDEQIHNLRTTKEKNQAILNAQKEAGKARIKGPNG